MGRDSVVPQPGRGIAVPKIQGDSAILVVSKIEGDSAILVVAQHAILMVSKIEGDSAILVVSDWPGERHAYFWLGPGCVDKVGTWEVGIVVTHEMGATGWYPKTGAILVAQQERYQKSRAIMKWAR